MSNQLYFSCSYKDTSNKWVILARDIKVEDINTNLMLSMMNYIELNKGGIAKLEIFPEPEVGLSSLTADFDGEKYLFTLVEFGMNNEYLIRTKKHEDNYIDIESSLSPGLVYFMGEPYPSPAITRDFEFIKKVFVEFLETGNISYDLMD